MYVEQRRIIDLVAVLRIARRELRGDPDDDLALGERVDSAKNLFDTIDRDLDAHGRIALFYVQMPDSPEIVAEELRTIARSNVSTLDGIKPQDTIEWDAAAKLEVASRALREIRDGSEQPRTVAAVALMELNE